MEEFPAINPLNFFQLTADCRRLPKAASSIFQLTPKNHHVFLLPNTCGVTGSLHFADIAMGWDKEGIEVYVNVNKKFDKCSFPDISNGDALELFIDTRDVKSAGYATKFCHHFFVLPESVDGNQAGEITRFRGEDTHEICNPSDIKVKAHFLTNSYFLQIFIPAQCLHGYDPDQFNRMGFTYRVHRFGGSVQDFSVVSSDYAIEQQPALWSSLRLC